MEIEIHSWKIRRRFMFVVVAFCMLVILGALFLMPNGSASSTAIIAAFTTISATMGSYVFGATWDDRNKSNAVVNEFRALRGDNSAPYGKGDN